jgi:ribosome-dependent ATPase
MTVLVSTAYMEEAERFDRLAAMAAGRLLAEGTPADLIEQSGANSLEDAYRAIRAGSQPTQWFRHRQLLRDGEPVISARGLTRRFGDFTAVDEVSFDIHRGEIFGFIGSNGCGKSTTMRMLTGLLPPSSGEAWLFGRPIGVYGREARRRIGYMSQAFSLYGELTVQQNLDLHARLFALPTVARRARIAELLERFGLEQHVRQTATSLPLGVRQRLSLAVAVLHEPQVLILDEPTSGVDPITRREFWTHINALVRRGVTVLVTTHFMDEAEYCDRVALMYQAQLIALDTPDRLKASAATDEHPEPTMEDAFIALIEAADTKHRAAA